MRLTLVKVQSLQIGQSPNYCKATPIWRNALLEIAAFVVAVIGSVGTVVAAFIAWKTLKRTPKLPEPPAQCGIIAFDVVQMPEAPGLPGYDRKRRGKGLYGRD
jgi:hypothetical protein